MPGAALLSAGPLRDNSLLLLPLIILKAVLFLFGKALKVFAGVKKMYCGLNNLLTDIIFIKYLINKYNLFFCMDLRFEDGGNTIILKKFTKTL